MNKFAGMLSEIQECGASWVAALLSLAFAIILAASNTGTF